MSILPAVHAALAAGRIDRHKADVFVDYLDPERLGRAQIDRLVEQLLPPAQTWTRRQLAARLLRAIIAIDPDAARRPLPARGARPRRGLPARRGDRHRDDQRRWAAPGRGQRRLRPAGPAGRRHPTRRPPGRLRQIAADLFLGMLDGRWHGHTEQQIIADLLARRRPEDHFPAPSAPPAEPGQLELAAVLRDAAPTGAVPVTPAGPDPVTRGLPADARDRCPRRGAP
jgi:hypothetical protein